MELDRFASFEADMWYDVAMEVNINSDRVMSYTDEKERLEMGGFTKKLDQLKEELKQMKTLSKKKDVNVAELRVNCDNTEKALKEMRQEISEMRPDSKNDKALRKTLTIVQAVLMAYSGCFLTGMVFRTLALKGLGTLASVISAAVLGKKTFNIIESKNTTLKGIDNLLDDLQKIKANLNKVEAKQAAKA